MAKDYEINERDVQSVIHFLELNDPEHATPEMAISILEHMMATYHTIAHQDPEVLVKMYEEVTDKNIK